jgi:hypothetical protein
MMTMLLVVAGVVSVRADDYECVFVAKGSISAPGWWTVDEDNCQLKGHMDCWAREGKRIDTALACESQGDNCAWLVNNNGESRYDQCTHKDALMENNEEWKLKTYDCFHFTKPLCQGREDAAEDKDNNSSMKNNNSSMKKDNNSSSSEAPRATAVAVGAIVFGISAIMV